MASSQASGANQRSATMADMVLGAAKSNMATITITAQENVELQQVLLKTIGEYNTTKESGALKESAFGKKRRASRGLMAASSSGGKVAEATGQVLNRNQSQWKKWSIDLLRALVHHADPERAKWYWLQKLTSKDRLSELVEFLWDIKIHCTRPEKVAELDMSKYFRAYEKLGSRMQFLTAKGLEDGHIDWRQVGRFSVRVLDCPNGGDQHIFEITSKVLGSTIKVDGSVTNGDNTMKSVIIKSNFSLQGAYLQTVSDTYSISHFFPFLGRSLRRCNSSELGTTAPVPGGVDMADATDEAAGASAAGAGGVGSVGSASSDAAAAAGDEELLSPEAQDMPS